MDDAVAAPGTAELAAITADILARVRHGHVRVHCITNLAAASFTANILLAVGARPSLTIAVDEIADFVGRANALLINLGTLDEARRGAIEKALEVAGETGMAWVLDPVLIDVSRPRLHLAAQIAGRAPTAIRGNAAEIAALVAAHSKANTAAAYASETGTVLAVTGALDQITDGRRTIRLANGHDYMSQVTAVGCVTSALLAAFSAVEPDRYMAAACCIAAVGVAGEVAALKAEGPGTFQPHFIDALAGLDEAVLAERIAIA